MFFKIIPLMLVVFVFLRVNCDENKSKFLDKLSNSYTERQKRLLFFDEEGNLIKTYSNPIHDISQRFEKLPFFENFWKPFYNFIRPATFIEPPAPYMLPITNEVIQEVNHDPVYQNKLVYPARDMSIELNPLCEGKRIPIPSPKSCNNYLNCWDGWAFEEECPKGLLFSAKGYCDYYNNVNCGDRNMRDDSHPTCDRDFKSFVSFSNCNKFFICMNRVPIEFSCPPGLSFDMLHVKKKEEEEVSGKASKCISPMHFEAQTENHEVCVLSELVGCKTRPMNKETATDKPAPAKDLVLPLTVTPASNQLTSTTTADNGKTPLRSKTTIDSWMSSHVAISRQDAIRQLNLERIAKVNVA